MWIMIIALALGQVSTEHLLEQQAFEQMHKQYDQLSQSAQAQVSEAVLVQLTDFAIDMPSVLPPGPTVFEVRNIGRLTHSLAIRGPGVYDMLAEPLAPGQSTLLEVMLQPGEYDVWCPVSDHHARGMSTKVTVPPQYAERFE